MKDFLAGFFSTLAATGIIMLASCQHSYAQTDEEYVKAVGKEFRHAWDSPSTFYGHVEVQVLVTEQGAVLLRPSKNATFNAEVLRAANAALDSSVVPGLTFPVEFNRKLPSYQNRQSTGDGGEVQE